jgi:DegV family protein with EDD domain
MTELPPHIVTDSTADIPVEIARRLDITVIPCLLYCNGQTFRDGVDLTRAEFYRRLRAKELFKTSQPAVGVFAATYRRALADGRPVVAIHLAAGLSGLYSTAYMAAQEVDPECVTVIDSQQVTMCTGWLAIHAAEQAKQGRSAAEIVAEVQQMRPRLRLLALIDDLLFLQHSGRVNWIYGMIGSLFSIKPIVLVRDGAAPLVAKARTFAHGIARLAELAAQYGPIERLAVVHADAPGAAAELTAQVRQRCAVGELLTTDAGVIVCAHAGPGAVGVACLLAR